jgi:hypothetical protein
VKVKVGKISWWRDQYRTPKNTIVVFVAGGVLKGKHSLVGCA